MVFSLIVYNLQIWLEFLVALSIIRQYHYAIYIFRWFIYLSLTLNLSILTAKTKLHTGSK